MNEILRFNIILNGIEYEIVVFQSENGYTVRGLQNNQIMTASYGCSFETEQDMLAFGKSAFESLIDLVISDLRRR